MKRSMRLGIAGAALAALSLPLIAGFDRAHAEAVPGKAAPAFSGEDTSGKPVSLDALKGQLVVLEWTNHECPYTVKHYATGNMQALQKAAAGKGVTWVSVVSSAPGSQGHVKALEADKLTADRKASPTHVVLDPDGKLGRAYGARTTPHMYVIGKDGAVVYAGAIDDQPSASQASVKTARNYVSEAIDAVLAGQPVKTAATRAYGCSVKYKPTS